jgi:hyperosmotically inducible periplasmic protein
MKNLLVALICAASLAGCAGMGDRGAKQDTGQRSAGQVVDDAAITAQVKAALAADPDLSALKINVDTAQGAVKLKGEVKTIALRRKANDLAAGIKGVKSVDNQLVITG